MIIKKDEEENLRSIISSFYLSVQVPILLKLFTFIYLELT